MMFTDLPRDLESEILSRVPATSLSKLRSTCKRWCALFKDPRFSKKNFGKGATHVILKKDRVYSVNVNLHGINNSFDPSIEFAGKLNGLKDSQQVDISQMFHCDGLLLCITKDRRLVVWNPCTGQTRWIKCSNHNIDTPYVACFLGYVNNNNNNSCNSYKILRISYNHQQSQVAEFEIYEFNSDSWRLLDDVTYNWSRLSSGVSLNGNTYWVAINRKEPFENKILLKFDFTRERFESLSLPFQTTYLDRTPLLSVVREEKLYLLLERRNTDSLERKIWVTDAKIDEANDTNIKYFLVADLSKFNILKGMNSVTSFLLDEENKMVVCCRRENGNEESTMIYIIGKEGVHVCKQVHGEDYLPLLVSYVPSLVQIQ